MIVVWLCRVSVCCVCVLCGGVLHIVCVYVLVSVVVVLRCCVLLVVGMGRGVRYRVDDEHTVDVVVVGVVNAIVLVW